MVRAWLPEEQRVLENPNNRRFAMGPVTFRRAHYGRALTKLGKAVAALGRLAEAEAILREALAICRLKLTPDEPDVRDALDALCQVLDHEDKRDESREVRLELDGSRR